MRFLSSCSWNWGVPEGKAAGPGGTPGETPWPEMIQEYAAAAPAIGAKIALLLSHFYTKRDRFAKTGSGQA
jgi:hypothetical protein